MQLDPKGLEAAKDVMRSGSGILIMGQAFDATMEAAIRAYLAAAPSPSPAPVVVEALRGAHDAFDTIAECAENCIHSPGQMTNYSTAKYGMALVSTALASLSQPAKGEREGGGV